MQARRRRRRRRSCVHPTFSSWIPRNKWSPVVDGTTRRARALFEPLMKYRTPSLSWPIGQWSAILLARSLVILHHDDYVQCNSVRGKRADFFFFSFLRYVSKHVSNSNRGLNMYFFQVSGNSKGTLIIYTTRNLWTVSSLDLCHDSFQSEKLTVSI